MLLPMVAAKGPQRGRVDVAVPRQKKSQPRTSCVLRITPSTFSQLIGLSVDTSAALYAFLFSIALETAAMFAMMVAYSSPKAARIAETPANDVAAPPTSAEIEPPARPVPRLVASNPPAVSIIEFAAGALERDTSAELEFDEFYLAYWHHCKAIDGRALSPTEAVEQTNKLCRECRAIPCWCAPEGCHELASAARPDGAEQSVIDRIAGDTMGRGIAIELATRSFANQKEAIAFFSTMLHRYTPGDTVTGDDRLHLAALLERHDYYSDKVGVGVERFEVMMTEHGTPCFRIVRKDGTGTDVSFRYCITRRAPTRKQEVSQSFRRAVRFQLYRAREAFFAEHEGADGLVTCAATGERISGHCDDVPAGPWAEARRRSYYDRARRAGIAGSNR
jgi:hypothetical protein